MENEFENPVFGRGGNSTQQRGRPLFRPETVSAANPCSRMKFMHIKCISDKKKICWSHTEQHFSLGSMLQDRFLGIFWQNFWHFLKKRPAVAGVQWPDIPQTLGASKFISKEHPTIILDVQESPKTSGAKRAFFLDLVFFHFFIRNFPVDEPAFFFKKKSENLAGKTACFFSV